MSAAKNATQLLKTVADLRERADCLPSSDENQAILCGILVVLKLILEDIAAGPQHPPERKPIDL